TTPVFFFKGRRRVSFPASLIQPPNSGLLVERLRPAAAKPFLEASSNSRNFLENQFVELDPRRECVRTIGGVLQRAQLKVRFPNRSQRLLDRVVGRTI